MCFSPSIDYCFLPARTGLMNKIIAAAFRRIRGVLCIAFYPSTFIRLELVTLHLTRRHSGTIELSTAVDNCVRNFCDEFSFNFKVLTGEHHG